MMTVLHQSGENVTGSSILGEPDIKKNGKKWPESSRILDYILSYFGVSEV